MTTGITTISSSLLVDKEGACVSCSNEKINQVVLRRSNTAFSEMKTGKFRKLFNHHALAFKH